MRFIYVDHLNTPRLVADAAGTTVWRWDQQEPFGSNPADENPSGLGVFDLPLRFAGQRYDVETGLHYNYFRDYNPTIGRYGESDPIGLRGGVNTYVYADADPLSVTDPLGLLSITVSTGGSGFVGTMGASAASGVAIDFSSGNLCFYSIICARVGLGLHFALQFLQVGVGTSSLCTGQYKVDGGFLSGGPLSGSVRYGEGGASVSTGRLGGGPGWGMAAGAEGCHVTLECKNECRKSCQPGE